MIELTLDDFRHRASLSSQKWHSSGDVLEYDSGDYLTNPELEDVIRKNAVREAAVMIGVFEADDGPRVLLTKRTAALRTHSGQIAFPGGRVDDTDRTFEATALRETHEETGIAPDHIETVGRLPVYFSGSGYRIHPILAVISGDYTLKANPDEVDAIFDVPLSFLMDETNHRLGHKTWNDQKRYFYEMPYEDYYIWGVSAGILRVMYERLYR